MNSVADPQRARIGVLYGLAAYVWWGLVVGYFKLIGHVPALEVLAHRIVWSVLVMAILMSWRQRWPQVLQAFRSRRVLLTLVASTLLVAGNWFVFIWAVTHEHVVQASLGYFINPLVNVLLGFFFLRERLRPMQRASVALAAVGVTLMAWRLSALPSVALYLAVSFALYGLLRKTVAVEAMAGLCVETILLAPIALGYLYWLSGEGNLVFGRAPGTDLLLVCAGLITALPLLWFAHAARRLDLATIGFLQYISPSLQLAFGVLVYGETFDVGHARAFCFIWAGLALYSFDAVRRRRTPTLAAPRPLSAT
jgi:chloramphenicol-sensitive protein RarD